MYGILIDSYNRIISAILLPDNDVHLYHKEVNQALKCTTHLYATSEDGTYQIIADEDCLLKNDNIAFHSSFMPRPLFGNIILIGVDPATGNKTDLPDDIDLFSISVEFCTKEQTEQFREETLEYVRQLNEE